MYHNTALARQWFNKAHNGEGYSSSPPILHKRADILDDLKYTWKGIVDDPGQFGRDIVDNATAPVRYMYRQAADAIKDDIDDSARRTATILREEANKAVDHTADTVNQTADQLIHKAQQGIQQSTDNAVQSLRAALKPSKGVSEVVPWAGVGALGAGLLAYALAGLMPDTEEIELNAKGRIVKRHRKANEMRPWITVGAALLGGIGGTMYGLSRK